jgi:hypothetical protein
MGTAVELAGRVKDKRPTASIYNVRYLATSMSDTGLPTVGGTGLTLDVGDTTTVRPICQGFKKDELRYPKRVLVLAVFESPFTRTEFQA